MDIADTIAPRSDQMNADDLIGGPRTFIITAVAEGNAEQPFNFYLNGFPDDRPYKPGLSMRRVMVAGWGKRAAIYVGRALTLYCDPDITFGRDRVGGIRISHMSDLPGDRPLEVALTVKKGSRKPFTVQPLPPAEILRAEWRTATPERRVEIEAAVAELTTGGA